MDFVVNNQVRVPDPSQHVRYGIGHHGRITPSSTFSIRGLAPIALHSSILRVIIALPTRFDDAWDLTTKGQIPEADPTHLELPDVAPRSPTGATAVIAAYLKLRLPLALKD